MTDRPIIFSAPMVRALLEGRKTQTRRLLNPQPELTREESDEGPALYHVHNAHGGSIGVPEDQVAATAIDYAPWQVGDRLWVRESWRTLHKWDCLAPRALADDRRKVTFEADPENRNPLWAFGKLRPAIFMPRWASRLTLVVTEVRVEQLLDISEEDAAAEGFASGPLGDPMPDTDIGDGWTVSSPGGWASAAGHFQMLWCELHPDWDGFSSPWVAAITFEVHRCNIDAPADPLDIAGAAA